MLTISIGLAQEKSEPSADKDEEIQKGWITEISLGMDFMSNLLINPAVGGGESRLGISGSLGLDLQYEKGLLSWNTLFSLNHGIQKNGTGILQVLDTVGMPEVPDTLNIKMPFQKNIDNIWLNSRMSLRTSYFSQFYYTADLFFSSQLTRTYNGNFLSDINQAGSPVSRFLAPGTLQFSPGMEYRHNDYLSLFFTPASLKTIFVLDDDIADDIATDRDGNIIGTIHGNPYTENQDGTFSYRKVDVQLGAALRVVYNNEITEHIALNSNLGLFTNYLSNPDHIDINWRNELNITIVKGLRFSLLSFLTYDHDVFVQKTNNSKPGGIDGLGRRVSYTQQFLLKYTLTLE